MDSSYQEPAEADLADNVPGPILSNSQPKEPMDHNNNQRYRLAYNSRYKSGHSFQEVSLYQKNLAL